MKSWKKYAWGAAGAVVLLAVLLAALAFLMPRWINGEAVKAGILARVSRAAGGTMRYDRLDLAWFPRPRIVVRRLVVDLPHRAAGTVESMTLYPVLFPLFRGGYRVAKIVADAPDLAVEIPSRGKEEKPLTVDEVRVRIADLLSSLSADAPGLVIEVRGGRVALSFGPRPVCALREVEGRIVLPPKRLEVDVRCASNLWGSLTLNGSLDAAEWNGRGTIGAAGLDLAPFAERFLPGEWGRRVAGRADIGAGFVIGGFRTLKAEVRGESASLSVRRGNGTAAVSGLRVVGSIEAGGRETVVSATRLSLESPRLRVSGRLVFDRAAPHGALELLGGDVDIEPARKALLTLAGDVDGVRNVLDYVRGGRLALSSLKIGGPTIFGSGAFDRLYLKGHLETGNIFVPAADLDLREVAGDVELSRGILAADHAAARVGDSRARDGSLRMGFTGRHPPFRLDARVDADLARLPRVLRRLTGDKGLEEVLSRIEDLTGKAAGRLTIGDRIGSLRVTADAADLRLSARYRRIPFPVEVDGGRLLFEENGIAVERLSGRLGRSAFSGVAARIRLGESPALERFSGNVSAVMGELYPWVASLGGMETARANVRKLDGFADLAVARLDGPIDRPAEWRYEASGSIRDAALEDIRLPGPVSIAKGAIRLLDRDGTFSIAGSIALRDGTALSGEYARDRDGFVLRHGTVRDDESLATIDLRRKGKELDVGFSGHLAGSTVGRLFRDERIGRGSIAGDLQARVALDHPARSTAEGHLAVKEIHMPRLMGPLAVKDLSLRAAGRRIEVASSDFSWGKTRFSLTGNAIASGDALAVDMDLATDGIAWDEFRATVPGAGREGESAALE